MDQLDLLVLLCSEDFYSLIDIQRALSYISQARVFVSHVLTFLAFHRSRLNSRLSRLLIREDSTLKFGSINWKLKGIFMEFLEKEACSIVLIIQQIRVSGEWQQKAKSQRRKPQNRGRNELIYLIKMVRTSYPAVLKSFNKSSLFLVGMIVWQQLFASVFVGHMNWKRGKVSRLTHYDPVVLQVLNNKGIREKLIYKPFIEMTPGDMNNRLKQYAWKHLMKKQI